MGPAGLVLRWTAGRVGLLTDVEANERSLRVRQDELEAHLVAAPAANWQEAAEKARYLLNLFAATLTSQEMIRADKSLIQAAATKVYRRVRKGSYELFPADF